VRGSVVRRAGRRLSNKVSEMMAEASARQWRLTATPLSLYILSRIVRWNRPVRRGNTAGLLFRSWRCGDVDDFCDRDLVDVAHALLTLIVIDEDDVRCLAGHRFDQPRRRCVESVEHELRLGAHVPSGRLDVGTASRFQIGVRER